jgi:large subunit ribosomal protein L32e
MADSKTAGAKRKADKTEATPTPSVKDAPSAAPGAVDKAGAVHKAGPKPKLTPEQRQALGLRKAKDAQRPAFRRHEWWRYKRLGGKNAPWRLPRGLHSKVRRHFKHRPPLVSIGYRGPAEVRGLHPSGFEEVLVHNPDQLAGLDKLTQAVRIGGTVGGRKAKLIAEAAGKAGLRVLNPPTQGGS